MSVPPLAIIVSRYHAPITSRLLDGAIDRYRLAGGDQSTLGLIDSPGAFELPALALAAARSGLYRGIIALGCIVKGETRHDRYISDAVAHGLMRVSLDTGLPVGFGVLTVKNQAQARARAGIADGKQEAAGNKGEEAMAAVLDAVASLDAIAAARATGDPGAVKATLFRTIAKLGAEA